MSSSRSAGLEPGASGSGPFTTPTKRAAFASSADAGPSRARPAGASPACSSRRHSLYGIEDRVVIDPGSRIWKVGFSGEPEPRAVFLAQDGNSPDRTAATEAWDLDLQRLKGVHGSRSEGERLVGVRIVKKLRDTYVKHLLADSKARKVIILENTFLPNYVKEHIARALFDNLQIPSISFTPSSLLALVACGRITGLVIDVGWLEATITPVFHSRPLYTLARSTPLAGRRLHSHLRNLLHHHAVYIPPPSSMSTIRSRERIEGIPLSILTDQVVERILTEGCFVGGIVVEGIQEDSTMEVDEPEIENEGLTEEDKRLARQANEAKKRYAHTSSAKDMTFRVTPVVGSSKGMGSGTIIVPGWIRERAAEVLFDDDEEGEERSIPRDILHCLLKLPIDLRESMISSLLVVGGTPSLPGFIPRLRVSLLHHLLPPPAVPSVSPDDQPRSPLNTPAQRMKEVATWKKRKDEPYKALYGLSGQLSILNDPAPLDGGSGEGSESRGGRAPRWTPGLMSWVGGSLAGSLKTSAPELTRETYDTLVSVSLSRGEAYREELEASEVEVAALAGVSIDELKVGEALDDVAHLGRKRGWRDGVGMIGDWSRSVKV